MVIFSGFFWRMFFASIWLALAGCSTVQIRPNFIPSRTTLAVARVALPTLSGCGALFVDVMINGAGPFHLMVDTGADCLVLTQRVADFASLKTPPGQKGLAEGVTEMVPVKLARVGNLESGGLKLEGLWAVVVSDADLANAAAIFGVPVDGALGRQALNDVVLEMDFPRRQVSAVKPGAETYPADRGATWQREGSVLTVDVEGKAMAVELDTGSNGGFMLPQIEALPLLYPKSKLGVAGAGVGKTTSPREETSQLAGVVRLGPVAWTNPPLVQGSARIGVAALDTWKLVIDQHAQRVYFLGGNLERKWEKKPLPPLRFRPGFFARIEGTGFRLLEVDAGAAADLAGLRIGDLVLTVNGAPATKVDYTQAGETQNGSRLKMQVWREGREFETTLVLGPNESKKEQESP